jgi:hypothetical protein
MGLPSSTFNTQLVSVCLSAKGFIVIRASHKTITGNACRIRKLLVIQQVGSMPNSIKATYLVATASFGLLKHKSCYK